MLKVTRNLLMFAVGVGAAFPTLASAQPSNATGTVFVMTNDTNKNEAVAFERSANSTLGRKRHLRHPTAAAAAASLTRLSRKARSPSARNTLFSSPSTPAAATSPSTLSDVKISALLLYGST
jgi:hypothetical protein